MTRRPWRSVFFHLAPALIGSFLMIFFRAGFSDYFLPLELRTIDHRFQSRGPRPFDGKLVEVDLDTESANRLVPPERRPWPWPRQMHGQLVDILTTSGAKAIVFDIFFPNPRPDEDAPFVDAVKRSGRVYFPVAASSRRRGQNLLDPPPAWKRFLLTPSTTGYLGAPEAGPRVEAPTLDALLAGAAGLGHIHRPYDEDGILRRVPLFTQVKGGYIPALGFAAALDILGADRDSIEVEWGRSVRFRRKGRGDSFEIPVDLRGRMVINFTGPWGHDRSRHVPYWRLVEASSTPQGKEWLRKTFDGAAVVVANLTVAAQDRGPTPFDQDYLFGEVHLNILHTLLGRHFLRDYAGGNGWYDKGVSLVHAMVLLGATGTLTAVSLVAGPLLILLAGVLISAGYIILSQYLFSVYGIILPLLVPLGATLVTLLLILMYRFARSEEESRLLGETLAAESRFWRNTFGYYFPPELVERYAKDPGKMLEWRQQGELTILFSDIKGFTSFSDRKQPSEVQRILSEYFDEMTQAIYENGGVLDKFMGDGILAFFGVALGDSDSVPEEERVRQSAVAGVKTALDMQRRIARLNQKWAEGGLETHQIRIGVNTGFVTVGNMGSSRRVDFTVLGTEVNKAQRFESSSPPGGLMMGTRTYHLAKSSLPQDVDVESMEVRVKNIDYPIPAFVVKELDKEEDGIGLR